MIFGASALKGEASSRVCPFTITSAWALSPDTAEKFGTRGMALTIPFVLYGLAHYCALAARGKGGRPEKILLHDRRTQLCIALYLATCAAVWLAR